MENQLSILSLIAQAGPLVKMVMFLLLLASIVSWAMIIQRVWFFRKARANLTSFENTFWSGVDLSKLFREKSQGETHGAESIFRAGFREFSRLGQQLNADSDAIMEGSQRAMRIAKAREEDKLDKHLAFLATVGSTSPYIGLFGTVWGIMNSFRELANVQQATLATVAPGISEALVATAMGLFAAIPAVIAYNRFATASEKMNSRYENFSDEFYSILHRQVHSSQTPKESA